MNRTIDRLLCILFPRRCAFCGCAIPFEREACDECLQDLPVIDPPVCPRCGRGKRECCCDGHRMAYDRCVAPYYYDGPVRRGLLGLKANGKRYAAGPFARAMAETVRREYDDARFDLIVPVPMCRDKERERGYNQCELLARALAGELGIAFGEVLCQVEETQPQKNLPAAFRKGNVLGAYDCAPGADVAGKCILLVDDVSTTGATMHECAKILKLHGAAEVFAVAAAVTRLSKGHD